jgi:hypothetical protein
MPALGRRAAAAGLVAFVGLGGVAAAVGAATHAASEAGHARRVLVFAMPYVSWDDVTRAAMPNLDRFVRDAAVAGLSTRVDARETPVGDGYATIGAGTRTVATDDAPGGGLMVDERFGVADAGEVYIQRTGRRPDGAIVQTGIVGLLGANARLHYDSEVGALADALAEAGVGRAVIANGDGEEPDAGRSAVDVTPGPARQRAAVLGLMDHDGQVAGGRVDPGLLMTDPAAPFGLRLDRAAVLEAFRNAWTGRTVALVEASDLVRAGRAGPYATDAQRRRQLDAALADTDRLFGALVDEVDLDRDVVVVVGPAHGPDAVTLTPLAIRGPGFAPGLLRSATTRRSGFVQIQDVAPTILAALGIDPPASMEGRAAEVGAVGGSAADRVEFIRAADAAARFRDARIGEVYGVLAATTSVIVAAGLLAAGRGGRARAVAAFVALWGPGLLAAAFLVRLFPLHEAGPAAYHAALLAVGALVAGACLIVGRRRPLDGLIAALAVVVVVLALDALRGAPLVLNSTLGYSPTVAGRFAGFGNPAYAAFSAAALCAAVLLAHRVGGRRGAVSAAVVLTAAVILDVAPMWGSDVGGILSMVPAYLVAMVVLTGRRVRLRTVVGAAVAVALVAVAAALVDVTRPVDDRTHLGRLVEDVRDNGLGSLGSVIERKLAMNVATLGTNILGLVLLVAVVGGIVWWRTDRARIDAVLARVPEWRAACLGFVVLAVLGFALNDSGMTVPGIMLVVFVSAWVHLLVTTTEESGSDEATAVAARPVGPAS